MPRRKQRPVIPRFRNEEEELRFWDTHDWEDYDDAPATDIILALKPTPKTRVTMWLDTPVVEALKRMARHHNMGYQTLARGLLRDSVRDVLESTSKASAPAHARQRKRAKARGS